MTLAERGKLGTLACAIRSERRAALVRAVFAHGKNLKTVAYEAGVPYRTACRYTQGLR